jgi:hypothetical protein
MSNSTRVATQEDNAAFLELGRALGGLPAGDGPPFSIGEAVGRAAQRAAARAEARLEAAAQNLSGRIPHHGRRR